MEHLIPTWFPEVKPSYIPEFSIIPRIRNPPLASQIPAPNFPTDSPRKQLEEPQDNRNTGGLDGRAWQFDPEKSRRTKNSNRSLPPPPPAPRKEKQFRSSSAVVEVFLKASAAAFLSIRHKKPKKNVIRETEEVNNLPNSVEEIGAAPAGTIFLTLSEEIHDTLTPPLSKRRFTSSPYQARNLPTGLSRDSRSQDNPSSPDNLKDSRD